MVQKCERVRAEVRLVPVFFCLDWLGGVGYSGGINNLLKEVLIDMPTISMFYGIIIYMYYFDNKEHKTPHIHANYGEHDAVISIPEGDVLKGKIPNNKLKLIKAWIEIHQEDLMADWKLSVAGQQPHKIEPLR